MEAQIMLPKWDKYLGNGIFRSYMYMYLSAFQWRFSQKEHVFGQFINLLSDNYNI